LTTKPIILHEQPVIHKIFQIVARPWDLFPLGGGLWSTFRLRANSDGLGLHKWSSRDTREEVDSCSVTSVPASELESDKRLPQHSASDSHKAAMSHVAETTRPLIIISVFWPDYSRIMCNSVKSLLFCKLCLHN